MQDHVRNQLSGFFEQASKAFPDLTANATALNYGTFGLTLAYPDNSVRKMLFHHHDYPHTQKMAEDGFIRETETLRILSGSAASGFIPELLEEPQRFDPETGFMGSYLMSRIDGLTPTWRQDQIAQTLQDYDFKTMAVSAGALLGRFHSAAEDIDTITPPSTDMSNHYGDRVRTIPYVSDKQNGHLERIDDHLQRHKVLGTVHGDLHGNNIVVNQNGIAQGLIDFARTASNANVYYDFTSVPSAYLDDFVCGYQRERNIDFDKRTVLATSLSCFTNYIHDLIARDEIDEALERSETVESLIEDFDNTPEI